MLVDEKIQAVLISLLLAYGALVAAPVILGNRVVEPFSELGLLGPEMKLGDYPQEVQVGESFDLFLYLGNHEGEPVYYRVLVKLGSREVNVSDEEPYLGSLIDSYEHALADEENVTIPISLSVPEEGVNRRLVFELYKHDRDEFKYDGIWVQLWLNVTRPE
jgi:uncharacterized membrane protein